MLAPTYFGSSLQLSGSFWIRLRYMKIQIGLVVYHITLVKWPVYLNIVVKFVVLNHDTLTHRPLNQRCMIYHQIDLHLHVN
jgi:hypothetical protein